VNNVLLIGRLTKDPELRFIPNSGKAVAKFSIAVNREFSKDKEADFFNVVVWGKTAEYVANYSKKGRLIAINGNMRNNNYEDKNGTKHYNIEVVANRVEILEWGDKQDNQSGYTQQSHPEGGTNQSYQQSGQNNQQNVDKSQDNMSGFQAIEGDDQIPF
jgi:single-strand DNA-binding protein